MIAIIAGAVAGGVILIILVVATILFVYLMWKSCCHELYVHMCIVNRLLMFLSISYRFRRQTKLAPSRKATEDIGRYESCLAVFPGSPHA